MEKKFLQRWRTVLAAGLLGVLLFGHGCGGSSGAPPVSIPAPATANIRISSPDENGLVTVSGAAGAVTANATVRVTNVTAAGTTGWHWLPALILRTAWAQVATSVETTADADGAFSVQIAADADDTLEIVAIDPDTGEESEAVTASVPDNAPPLSFTPVAVTVDNNRRAYVIGSSGGNGIVAVVDLATNTVSSTFNLTTSDPQDVAYDPADNELVIADTTNNTLLFVELADTDNQRAVDIAGPQSVAIDTSQNLAVVGTNDTTASVVLIDLATESASASATITNIDTPAAAYQGSPAVDSANGEAVIVSNFSDNSAQVTTKDITIPAFTNQQVFANSSLAGAARLGANQAVAVDQVGDRVLILALDGDPATATTISVGDQPAAVTIDTTDNRALVANRGAHTVSIIDLGSQSVTGTENSGINPVDIAYSASADATVVANGGSNSVTIIK